MKNMFFSLKWKLTLSLILSGCLLLGGYVILAKSIFENDKIAYVYESQGARLKTIAKSLKSQLEKSLVTVRAAMTTYDPALGRINETGMQLLTEDQSILAVEVLNESKSTTRVRMELEPGALPNVTEIEKTSSIGKLDVKGLDANRFLGWIRYEQGDEKIVYRMRFVVSLNSFFPQADPNQLFALTDGSQVIQNPDQKLDLTTLLPRLNTSKEIETETLSLYLQNTEFLVTSIRVGFSDMKVLALTPKKVALGALSTLLIRSMLFLFIAFCSLVILSLFLARKLTSGLGTLTKVAERVGKGDFKPMPVLSTHDEMEVLSLAMNQMTEEIERLVVETKDKARMESELKTASLVQEQLLPSSQKVTIGQMEIQGLSISSSECGGDWWHHFAQGDDLYIAIADATGHGTPAALITAAAGSIFSRIEDEKLSLFEMMSIWNRAIFRCSKGKVCMTAILVRLNTKTGQGAIINASHESPWVIRQHYGEPVGETLDLKASNPLGEKADFLSAEINFELGPKESLVLFTDGLFSVEKPDGKILSEPRSLKKLAQKSKTFSSVSEVVKCTQDIFEEHRENLSLPDDVTLVGIRRQA